MSQYGWENCPTEVRQQVERLCEGFWSQLAGNLIGIYLHGSLATDCFNPLRSDIDLLVVTRDEMTVETKRDAARFLLENSLHPSPIEISFLRRRDLKPWCHPTPFDFHYSEDWREQFECELEGVDWKQWNASEHFDDDLAAHITVLNHRGVRLYGEAIEDIFPSVPKEDFIISIAGDVLSEKFGFDAVLEYPVYVVLNSCRTLAFLQTGRVMSKDEGGRWALENLPVEFHRIIACALNEYRHNRNESNLAKEQLIDFAVYMKHKIKSLIGSVAGS